MYVLFENLTQKQADICALVLSSAGVLYRVTKSGSRWDVRVAADHYDRALRSMELYFQENRHVYPDFDQVHIAIRKENMISGLIVCIMLLLWYVLVQDTGNEKELINRFSASAVKILDGQYYRSVTGLLLHQDEVHLAGNLLGLFIFGTAVCAVTGWGAGWLMILTSGIAGNLFNAFMYESAHVSIGASTAVFGAIGILAGYQGFKRKNRAGKTKKAWVPVACGLALLGLLGSGGINVDIMAHLFGFVFGVLIGALYGISVKKIPDKRVQWVCAACMACIVFGSWYAG